LHVIAPISVDIPIVAINRLFSLDMYRLLSFFVLLPAAWSIRRARKKGASPRFLKTDVLLLAFGATQILLFVRPDTPDAMFMHDSITNVIRRAVLFFLDVYLVYYVVSRSCASRRNLVEAMAAFCLACTIMAPLAVFETVRHWILYAEAGRDWGGDLKGWYLDRGGILRATVSAGHSLALGYLLAIGFGFWLYLRTHVASRLSRWLVIALLLLGLLAAYSRGPWLGAALIFFAFIALGPRAVPRVLKAAFLSAIGMGALLLSPLGDRIVKVVPFLGGTVDTYNFDYRRELARRSWDIVIENPFFGDQEAYSKLYDIRQGEGIIDFVNTYAEVAVFYGLVTLFFFVGFLIAGLFSIYKLAKKIKKSDPDLALVGASLISCILGTLLMLATSSFVFGYEKLFYVLGGLAAAYPHLAALPVPTSTVTADSSVSRDRPESALRHAGRG
jgi:O-antigen ligase